MVHLTSLREILESWNVDIEISYLQHLEKKQRRQFGQQITKEANIDKMNDELAQECIDGLKNLEIHNYPQAINTEVSLLSLFCGLYGITNESIRAEEMRNIRQFNKLTSNAEKNYGQAASSGERKPNPWILTKILKYHNKCYYELTIQPLLKKNYDVKKQQKMTDTVQQIEKHEIDLKDAFTLTDVSSKTLNGQYENKLEFVAQDLLKVIKVKLGIKIVSQNPKIFSAFQGFKYVQVDEIDQTKIGQFLALVKDTISVTNELIYEYLLNWIAYIIQKAGKKIEIAPILQGLQSIGKNIFTNALCELLA
ncbi:MAG: hypothetical protein EZS28_019671 [Streblomastix strix]|uniref:Uncharacterized protein n=1 Tax=Streblomastix strix TaxID=222440 RepID=A0A5J4VR79_9EUKA|nr:MAG: hypothetical protein EZS28_019671 [Streblomastix strix]